MRVLVIGLTPSTKTQHNASLKRLYGWLDLLDQHIVSFTNLYESKNISEIEFIKSIHRKYDKILALGNEVSNELNKHGILHFKLPHPSGLNRQLNDEGFVYETIKECKNYLYGGTYVLYRP